MAITRNNYKSKAKQLPSLRIKQRDYTIPVRLNQLLSVQQARESISLSLVHRGSKSCIRDESNTIKKSNKKTIKQVQRHQVMTILVLALIAPLSFNFCHCDTQTNSNSGQQQHEASLSLSLIKNNNKQPQPVSSSSNNNGFINKVPHKEHLLSSLADSIEQQHFKTKPSRVFPSRQTRPSKLDVPDSYIDFDTTSSQQLNLHYPNKMKSIKKADEGLRQILQMHETVNRHQPSAPLNTYKSTNSDRVTKTTLNSKTRLKRWREMSPVRVVASSLIKPNKVMSQVLSYITPLVGAKLLDPSAMSTTLTDKQNNSSSPFRIIKLNPFMGRSGGNYATFSHEYNIFGPLRPSTRLTTSSPPTKSILSSESPSNNLLDNNFIDIKSPINEDSDEIRDLMADSSSLSSFVSNSPLWSGGSSGSSGSTSSSSSSMAIDSESQPTKLAHVTPSTAKPPTKTSKPQRGSSWIKNSANQLAQNYIQNSFRDLLTLSQLPILSASTISTAPSILEKKHSSTKKNKNTSPKTPLDEFRKRAIEELYRYAYILATGVKNKRDPLLALASYPSLAHLKLNKRGVFSQRSLNQLVSANQTQMVNLVRKLRSILSVGPLNRAKPRGVMWDMATDPSLAVTVFHLLERASVALPLGFMLMPFVRMIRNPLNGIDFGRILPPRATHRSVDYEELAKRLDVVDKMLNRALRSAHRESFGGK